MDVGVDLFRYSKALKDIEGNNDTNWTFRLRYRTDGVTVLGYNSEEIGRLDTKSASMLKGLKKAVASLRCDVNFVTDPQDNSRKRSSPEVSKVRLIVYGNEDECDLVGSFLSEAEIFLQEPDHIPSGIVYRNPHVYTVDNDNFATPRFLQNLPVDEMDFQEAAERIVYASDLPNPEAHVIQDHRLKTPLHRYNPSFSSL